MKEIDVYLLLHFFIYEGGGGAQIELKYSLQSMIEVSGQIRYHAFESWTW